MCVGVWVFMRWTVPEPCPNLLIECFLDFYLLKVVYRLKVDWLMEYLEFQLVRLLVLDLDFPFLKFHEFLCPEIFSVNRYLLGWVSSSWFSTPRSLVSNWLIMSERFFSKKWEKGKNILPFVKSSSFDRFFRRPPGVSWFDFFRDCLMSSLFQVYFLEIIRNKKFQNFLEINLSKI